MSQVNEYPWQQQAIIIHSQRMLHSYQHWTGESLFDLSASPEDIAQNLFDAPFIVVSHGTEPDPIFNYGNSRALELWELSWQEFTRMPSRLSAEEIVQEDRQNLLAEAAIKGFKKFPGVRISSTGKRFYIENITLWNVLDENKQQCGQAALYSQWKYV
ncbi:MAG: MEKHLA domain-containing protein [Methylacidiphilales bacterium]|nr:MEKHLA domain-containing protein [Candidatus Methylacidiphilales bacterium]NJR17540.1 MEKHLA domain-containing protein [Calothrix sp. CSU_2_0]